jgi:hypothetical protein
MNKTCEGPLSLFFQYASFLCKFKIVEIVEINEKNMLACLVNYR